MGYRSEVYLKAEISLLEEFKTTFPEENNCYESIQQGDEYFYVKWEYVKWYSNYEDVKKVNDWVTSKALDSEKLVGMIAIGEDSATNYWGNPSEVGLYETVIISGWIN